LILFSFQPIPQPILLQLNQSPKSSIAIKGFIEKEKFTIFVLKYLNKNP